MAGFPATNLALLAMTAPPLPPHRRTKMPNLPFGTQLSTARSATELIEHRKMVAEQTAASEMARTKAWRMGADVGHKPLHTGNPVNKPLPVMPGVRLRQTRRLKDRVKKFFRKREGSRLGAREIEVVTEIRWDEYLEGACLMAGAEGGVSVSVTGSVEVGGWEEDRDREGEEMRKGSLAFRKT
ncbi:hypothetical protein CC78DRAFT_583744 [Lojkania enalia]|uniref:Uncharacterized protein n=1 Tax=Lojkania enalia TaxID=147567 RepID=A0A9P4K502_9PLEO|nr:hypothetical protein CC78DRAFT_583744 [Didymosphaeria enalia]